jgi:hypothetical protein
VLLGLLLNFLAHLFDILPCPVRGVFTTRGGETEQRCGEEHEDETLELYDCHNEFLVMSEQRFPQF